MSYATLDDLIARAGLDEIVQIADRDGDGVADADAVAAALLHADTTIDGYLATRHAVPVAPPPPIVGTWAVAIARYWLHRFGAPENVAQDYRDAIAALRDVAKGVVVLPGVPALAGASTAAGGPVLSQMPEAVTPHLLAGY